MKPYIVLVGMLLLIGVGCSDSTAGTKNTSQDLEQPNKKTIQATSSQVGSRADVEALVEQSTRIHFGQFDPSFRFSAEMRPDLWEVEYVPSIKSLNIYTPTSSSDNVRDQSIIFIRQFEADRFLTLSTVDILSREEKSIHGHDAVMYRIKKKPGVADFVSQPDWRNEEHQLIDIRLQNEGRSLFYVFSYAPELDPAVFNTFIDSLEFDSDVSSYVLPMDAALERITKKPFGLYVTPEDSPVSPERFRGYHTGIDFEAFPSEIEKDVPVYAFCGGPIESIRTVNGYGGLLTQRCLYKNEQIVVLYGHINANSVEKRTGDYLTPGEVIGFLGDHYSEQTSNERKHLHFSIYRTSGFDLDIRGYVPSEDQLDQWIDPKKEFPELFSL